MKVRDSPIGTVKRGHVRAKFDSIIREYRTRLRTSSRNNKTGVVRTTIHTDCTCFLFFENFVSHMLVAEMKSQSVSYIQATTQVLPSV
jgi:hypothetical protein